MEKTKKHAITEEKDDMPPSNICIFDVNEHVARLKKMGMFYDTLCEEYHYRNTCSPEGYDNKSLSQYTCEQLQALAKAWTAKDCACGECNELKGTNPFCDECFNYRESNRQS